MAASDDYRSMFGAKYVGAWDLGDKDVTLTISAVKAEELKNKGGSDKRPVLYFTGTEKAFVCNKTNARSVATLYGPKVSAWIGKKITLYATKTQLGGETVDAIRIRPVVPASEAAE